MSSFSNGLSVSNIKYTSVADDGWHRFYSGKKPKFDFIAVQQYSTQLTQHHVHLKCHFGN
ncbi:hypothetical protein BLA29_006757 [Euroglyphus maynei]|uniref:Uncharacterized protein n=1 Tax=Euroglyphus maynei TaxID=6958 RepID=A0A1Y3AVX6_EURMA|nr:hypothetical protein BLA29_006757 [Euroglyphus maynei]